MVAVTLRPMSMAEFDEWMPRALAAYGGDLARWGGWSHDRATQVATAQFAAMLPDGAASKGHHLLIADAHAESVGTLWLHVTADDVPVAFVCDVEVDPALRGRGYGRAMMLAAEAFARDRGATSIRLNVFAQNVAARGLYSSLGFEAASMEMTKRL